MNLILAGLLWLVSWVLAEPGAQSKIKQSYPDIDFITWLRERFLLSLSGSSSDSEALVAGLTIGERSLLSEQVAQEMKTLSLTHLVAVSGANLAIVVGAVYFLLAACAAPRNLRFAVALLAMAGYVLLVGPESSVIRAATMAVFVMIGLWLGRGSSALNSLSLAIVVLLVSDPALATDIGFALSAFATAGLLVLAQPLFEFLRRHLPDFLALGIAASASAQLFTTPVLLILQPSIPLYSVVANVIVEPVVAPITILGIASVLVSSVSIQAASAFSYLASLLANWIVFIAGKLSEWPLARLHFVSGSQGIALVAIFVLLVSLSFHKGVSRKLEIRFIAAAVVIVAASWSVSDVVRFNTFAGNFDVLACDVGQGDALILESQGQVALIDVGRDDIAIDRCLSSVGIQHIDLLVLSHYDADHVGGIAGALNGRSVGVALTSGFEDDRPLVSVVAGELDRKAARVVTAGAGMQGTLGDFSWSILQPSFDAAEANDSNDASLIFAAWGKEFGLLSLGDLGEAGQLRLIRSQMPALATLKSKTLVIKVAHHGSADQSAELFDFLEADYAVFSVGKNDYGHPTQRALDLARGSGAVVLRTDQHGPIALRFGHEVEVLSGGKLSM